MTSCRYLPITWMDPRQDIRPSAIHGLGIFARQPIRRGEPVEIIGGDLMTEAEFRAFQQTTTVYNAVQIGDDLHLVERLAVTQRRPGSINHACDSNLWLMRSLWWRGGILGGTKKSRSTTPYSALRRTG